MLNGADKLGTFPLMLILGLLTFFKTIVISENAPTWTFPKLCVGGEEELLT
jgi:C4-dicarboxylate transporter